jgi:Glycosyl hydrolases family 16
MRWILISLTMFVCSAAYAACPGYGATPGQMGIIQPCALQVVTANQAVARSLRMVAIDPASERITAGANYTLDVYTPGLCGILGCNVEVWTHGKMAVRLTHQSNDHWTGTLELHAEPVGPLTIGIFAWNSTPGNNGYTVSLQAFAHLIVTNSCVPNPFPTTFKPAGAQGMSLVWSDEFSSLSASPCKPGTGTWPHCTAPSVSDGFTWYENKPDGGDFGDAAFEHTDSSHNPYTIKDGFLRIRSTYDVHYVDPYGYNRHWYSGLLASAFPDGTSNAMNLTNGYYEARILTPDGSPNGGTWAAFWMSDLNNISNKHSIGRLEIDTTEQYGVDGRITHSRAHAYGNSTGDGPVYDGAPTGNELTWDFHRYGMQILNDKVTFYFDDQPLGSHTPRPNLQGNPTVSWFLLLNLAMGGGWPINPPPAGYYDMWIDYVRAYH